MAKTTDAPVAAPPEPALFRVLRRVKVQQGAEVVDVQPGTELDCSGWSWRSARASVEIGQLLPLNEAAQRLVYPSAFRERRPYNPPSAPPAITVCSATYSDATGRLLVCGAEAGHEPPHR